MQRKLRTLMVEDSEDDAMLLAQHLIRGGYELDWRRVDTADLLNRALDEHPWDIVFADFSMPRFSGVAALAIVRERRLDIPLIFVSGTIGEDVAVMALKAGANDYIMKGNLKRLLPAVERELREFELRRERLRGEQELRLLEAATRAGAEARDVPSAITASLRMMCQAAGWDIAHAWFPATDDGAMERSAIAFYCDAEIERATRATEPQIVARGEGLVGRAWLSKKSLWIEDALEISTASQAVPLHTALGVPVIAEDQVIAVLAFFRRASATEDRHVVRLFTTLADQLGGIIQRKRAEERLHYVAHYDHLTGLPNRVLFADRLQQAMLEANRHDRFVGVIFLDLDRFKTINDSLGHGIGDSLLKLVADRLVACVREGDTVARLAGDEFAIALVGMARADHAAHLAQKILDELSLPLHIGGHELYTGASIGLTLYPTDDKTVDGLLRNADVAMYRAKDIGGNGYQFYSANMTVKAHERLSLENDLRRALEREEFVLHYQPIVSLATRQVAAIESLLRWQHPRRGMLLPSEFIPLAEETGLIVPLGEWVLHEATRASARLNGTSGTDLRVGVNISAHQFRHNIVRLARAACAGAAIAPRHLQLEITESVLMQNIDAIEKTLRELRDMGVELLLDDFGTGYSSLSYLKRFPIDALKIDRSFVRDIPDDADDAAIASAIISMAHSLGIVVIAEGVETSAQLAFLRERNCDQIQGYYFSEPIAEARLAEFLRQNRVVTKGLE